MSKSDKTTKKPVNHQLVAWLTALLNDAKCGKITGIAGVAVGPAGATDFVTQGLNPAEVVGMLEGLKYRILTIDREPIKQGETSPPKTS